MKKTLILLLLLLFSLAFTACGGENDPGEEPGNSDQGSSGNDQGSSGNDQGSGNTDQGSNDNNQENGKPDEEELITPPGTYITDTEIGNNLEIKADFWEVSWEEVPGATEYIICVNDDEYRTEECRFLLFEYLSTSETVKLSVTPVTENGNDESLRSGIYYTTEEVTEGLSFKKLKDGSYAVYCPADKLPENGELVLPDSYDGCDVTEFRNPVNKTLNSGDSFFAASGEISDYVGPELSEISKVRLSSNLTTIGIGVLYKSAIKEIYIPEFVSFISCSAFDGSASLECVYGAVNLKSVAKYAFAFCPSLGCFPFPESLISVGDAAFAGSALEKAVIPNVQTLNRYAFINCVKLDEMVLSEEIKDLYPHCFDNTSWYNTQPDGLLYLGDVLYGYKGEMPENTKLTIKTGTRKLPSLGPKEKGGVFQGQENLSSIVFSDEISYIPPLTFHGCTNLKEVILPEALERIGYEAFHSTGIEAIVLPKSLKIIEYGVFEKCVNLKEIIIPGSVVSIGTGCFLNCSSLSKIIIENGVEIIEDDVFIGTAITELVIPDSVTMFSFSSIAYTNIKHFVFPKNIEIPSESYNAYTPKYPDGILLDYLVIQKETKNLDVNWFFIYKTINTFYYEGTEEEYAKIYKKRKPSGSFNGSHMSAQEKSEGISEWLNELTVYYYSEEKPADEGNYWHYVDGKPTKW